MTDHVTTVLQLRDCSGDRALERGPATQPILHGPLAVSSRKQASVKNAILARLSVEDLAAIGGSLEPIVLKERMVLQEPRRPVEHVYFMESGLVSLRVVAAGSMLETAVIGYRGAVGTSFLWGGHISPHQSVVLFPGNAYRIRVENLRRLMKERPDIRERLFEYLQALTFQCVQTGLCGVRHNREQRLASWLCLASDAVDACVLPVTHDYLSSVLGLRPGGGYGDANSIRTTRADPQDAWGFADRPARISRAKNLLLLQANLKRLCLISVRICFMRGLIGDLRQSCPCWSR
ncbi:CRP-like cAMP-binding protein [Bradyrhizobium sp. USDA 4524]